MTHTIFGHSMLYTAKTLPSPIHFTPLHSLHANTHGRPSFLQVYFWLSQLSLCQHLMTTNKFSGADMKSVVCTSRWSSTLCYLPVFWIQLVAFSHPLLHLKIAPCAVVARSSSGRGWICTFTFVKFVATFSQKCLYRSASTFVSLKNKFWKNWGFFLRWWVSWTWVWSTMVEMVCLSSVRFSV